VTLWFSEDCSDEEGPREKVPVDGSCFEILPESVSLSPLSASVPVVERKKEKLS
jgi:hypothetical protein